MIGEILSKLSEDQLAMNVLAKHEPNAALRAVIQVIETYLNYQANRDEDEYDRSIDKLRSQAAWMFDQVQYGGHIDSHQPLLNIIISYCRGLGRTKEIRSPRVYGRT